jgi:hypothetical protein
VRFAKVHPSFLILLFVSMLCLLAAFIMAMSASDACIDSNGIRSANPTCTVEAQSHSASATVLAIAGLAIMLGGVGFQIGRAGAATAMAPVAPQPMVAAPPPYPPYPPYQAPVR